MPESQGLRRAEDTPSSWRHASAVALPRCVEETEPTELEVAEGSLRRRPTTKPSRKRQGNPRTARGSYAIASAEASRCAEHLADFPTAYGRLAIAWATLSDALGRRQAAQMVRPQLEALRQRIGVDAFGKAKAAYEENRGGAPNGAGATGAS